MALMKRHFRKQIIFRFNKLRQNNNEACVQNTDYIFVIHPFHTVKYNSFPRVLFPKIIVRMKNEKYNQILNILFHFSKPF